MATDITLTLNGKSSEYTLATGGRGATGAAGPAGANGLAYEVKSASFTAAANGCYTATATLTITDPTPSQGLRFTTLVRNGTATIGGTGYATAGTVITRTFHSGAWANYVYRESAYFGTAATANSATAATASTVVLRGTQGEGNFAGIDENAITANSVDAAAVYGLSTNEVGVYGQSTNGAGVIAETSSGEHHAEFGSSGDNRSFVARVKGALGWFRGAFTGQIQAADTLTGNRTYTLPDATGTVSLVANAETLLNKTLTNPLESVVSIGNSGTTQTLALTNGTFQTVTLTGNCTFTMPTATAGSSFFLKVLTGAGGFTATFTGVKWPASTAPTITATASRYDLLSFVADGTAWSGSALQNFTP